MASPEQPVDLFIASIGERDPESPAGPTGPLRGALELRPGRVMLVAAPGVEAQAENTRQRIAVELRGASVTVAPLPVDDPTDLDMLLRECGRLLDSTLGQTDSASVAVCASSGTPQISLALTLAVLARVPGARHFQALDPSKTDTPWREVDPDALRHHAELDRALHALASCRSGEARSLLTRRLESGSTEARARRPAIRAACAVATALEQADALSPVEAYKALTIAAKGLPPEAAEPLQRLRDWYAKLRKVTKKNPAWPAELAARAAREHAAGRAPQALVAAAIAFEVALSVRLRADHGLDPDRLSASDLSRLPRGGADAKEFKTGVYRLEGAERRSEALAALDPAYEPYHDDERRKDLVEGRNHLVHAAKAPAAAHVVTALAFLDALFRALGWPAPSGCPSSPDAIRALVAALRPAAGLG